MKKFFYSYSCENLRGKSSTKPTQMVINIYLNMLYLKGKKKSLFSPSPLNLNVKFWLGVTCNSKKKKKKSFMFYNFKIISLKTKCYEKQIVGLKG